MVFANLDPFDGHHLLTFTRRALTQGLVLHHFALLAAGLDAGVHGSADAFGHGAPGKAKRQRCANQTNQDGDQARASKTQPARSQGPEHGSQGASAGIRQARFKAVQTCPLQHATGG